MRLILHITFRIKPNGGIQTIDWSSPVFDTRPAISPIGLPDVFNGVPEWAEISAEISGLQKNWQNNFRLQLAYAPDEKFDKIEMDGTFFTEKKSDDGWEKEKSLKLLQGSMGYSFLRLMFRDTRQSEWASVLVVPIKVVPAEDKLHLMDGMVDEIVPENPFLALSNSAGLSLSSMRREWSSGYVQDHSSSDFIELSEIEQLIMHLAPILVQVSASPESLLEKISSQIVFGRVRKIDARIFRIFGRKTGLTSNYHGHLRIKGYRKCRSYNTIAHRVLACFLRNRLKRLYKLKIVLKQQIGNMNIEISDYPDRKDIIGENLRQTKILLSKIETKMIPFFVYYSNFKMPWGCVAGSETILSVPRHAFLSNAAYKRLYDIIIAFEKKRFWPLAEAGILSIPKYSRLADVPSSWQKNYSYIYEAWVFIRLMRAFDECGYKMIGEYKRKIANGLRDIFLGQELNDPITVFTHHKSMQIDVYYGVEGRSDGKRRFSCTGRTKLTPDFLIVFTNIMEGHKNFGESHYIVIDAKSGRELGKEQIAQRDKYATNFFVKPDKSIPPDQSWLIYSGDAKGSSGIEFLPDKKPEACWKANIVDCLKRNTGFVFGAHGIKGEWRNKQPVGHLRVNINTIAQNDVFREFICGQIATARSRLGLLDL